MNGGWCHRRRLALDWRWVILVGVAGLTVLLPGRLAAADERLPAVRLFGVEYVDARDFGKRFGLSAAWATPQRVMRLTSKWTTIELTLHRVEVRLNGTLLFLSEPVAKHRGSLHLSRGDVDTLLTPLLIPHRGAPAPPLRTIVLDAGHGGNDPGNRNRALGLEEKVFTLDVVRRLEGLLRAAGYRVVLTRTRDRRVELDERTELARRAGADLFISIHFNSAPASVRGAETFVLTPRHQRSTPQAERDGSMRAAAYPGNRFDHWNVVLGYQLQRQLVGRLEAADRGLKRFRYRVLTTVQCPAVLVEAGFLSHGAEGRKVASGTYRQQIAAAIAAGVKQYAAVLARARKR